MPSYNSSAEEFVDAVYGMLLELESAMLCGSIEGRAGGPGKEKTASSSHSITTTTNTTTTTTTRTAPATSSKGAVKKAWNTFRQEFGAKRAATLRFHESDMNDPDGESSEEENDEEEDEDEDEEEEEEEEEEDVDEEEKEIRWRAEQPHYRMMMRRMPKAYPTHRYDEDYAEGEGGLVRWSMLPSSRHRHAMGGGSGANHHDDGGGVEEDDENDEEAKRERHLDPTASTALPSPLQGSATHTTTHSAEIIVQPHSPLSVEEVSSQDTTTPATSSVSPSSLSSPLHGIRPFRVTPQMKITSPHPPLLPMLLSSRYAHYFLFLQCGDVGGGYTGFIVPPHGDVGLHTDTTSAENDNHLTIAASTSGKGNTTLLESESGHLSSSSSGGGSPLFALSPNHASASKVSRQSSGGVGGAGRPCSTSPHHSVVHTCNSSLPAFPSYDALLPSLCAVLASVYQKFCDYDHLHDTEVIRRVVLIDKKLNKIFFSPLTVELEAAAHGKLWSEATLLTWDGLFSGCRYPTSVGGAEKAEKNATSSCTNLSQEMVHTNSANGSFARTAGNLFAWSSLFGLGSFSETVILGRGGYPGEEDEEEEPVEEEEEVEEDG